MDSEALESQMNDSEYTVWKQAIHPKKWRENFPATKIALLFMA